MYANAPPGSRREIFALAWPIWISMISVTTKGVVDMVMVGELGTAAIAGVGLANVLVFNVLCFAMGVLRSQKPLVSQYLGAGNKKESFRFGVQGCWLAVIFASFCLALALLQDGLFGLIAGQANLTPEALEYGRSYFDTRLAWGGAMLLYLSVAEYLRGTGSTRLPMATDLISQPLNILFNYALIFGAFGCPKMGVAGAAIGTGIADLISLVIVLYFARRPGIWSRLRFDWKRFKRVFMVGCAGGIQFTVEVGSYTLITFFIGYISTIDLAAHTAVINIMHFSFMSAVALADGGAVLIAKYVGAKDLVAVQKTIRGMLGLTIPVMLGGGILFMVLGEQIMAMYLRGGDQEMRETGIVLGRRLLLVAAVWQLGDAFQIVYRFALRATGDHKWVMWAGLGCAWGLSAPMAAIGVFVLNGDVVTVWWLWNVEIYFGAILFLRRWRGGAWRNKRLVEDDTSTLLS